ncbi:hypothetical protein HUJ04_003494 [Dendroctonus ponderosae]|nr:hypothetical protein HUJ04_003494 [Dendroctonus ponderosae]KAH1010161.1 hypothetical protein HUJ05_004501 [Dendroctonus ponderosae]
MNKDTIKSDAWLSEEALCTCTQHGVELIVSCNILRLSRFCQMLQEWFGVLLNSLGRFTASRIKITEKCCRLRQILDRRKFVGPHSRIVVYNWIQLLFAARAYQVSWMQAGAFFVRNAIPSQLPLEEEMQ